MSVSSTSDDPARRCHRSLRRWDNERDESCAFRQRVLGPMEDPMRGCPTLQPFNMAGFMEEAMMRGELEDDMHTGQFWGIDS